MRSSRGERAHAVACSFNFASCASSSALAVVICDASWRLGWAMPRRIRTLTRPVQCYKSITMASAAVTQIKRHATRIIAELQATREPVVITEHGRSAAVLLDVETWDELRRRVALLEGIARGERAFAEGRVVSHATARKRLRRWLARRR